jgi:hypothetical protein
VFVNFINNDDDDDDDEARIRRAKNPVRGPTVSCGCPGIAPELKNLL